MARTFNPSFHLWAFSQIKFCIGRSRHCYRLSLVQKASHFFSSVFYIVIFDFSIGALDRYSQLLILSLTVFSAAVLSEFLKIQNKRTKIILIFGIIIALILVKLQFLPQNVFPLYPKTEWISRFVHF